MLDVSIRAGSNSVYEWHSVEAAADAGGPWRDVGEACARPWPLVAVLYVDSKTEVV
jgi:hypothetical protein